MPKGHNLLVEVIKYTVEAAVLLLILREIRELRRHHRALENHSQQLDSVRPLLTTLYTDSDEIMDLAVSFTEEAKEIYALGTLSSLTNTERRPDESENDFKIRHDMASPRSTAYVTATRDFILSGARYCRIIDFDPGNALRDSISFEILANIDFFIRLYGFSGTSTLQLELYHSSEVLRGRGDFHFRCSDRQVIIRAGGHGNRYANAAIAVTDTRVVSEFRQYYQSLLASASTVRMGRDELEHLKSLFLRQGCDQVKVYLDGLAGAKG